MRERGSWNAYEVSQARDPRFGVRFKVPKILNATAKELPVTTTNSNYQKLGAQ
jgi:hypothetical protein